MVVTRARLDMRAVYLASPGMANRASHPRRRGRGGSDDAAIFRRDADRSSSECQATVGGRGWHSQARGPHKGLPICADQRESGCQAWFRVARPLLADPMEMTRSSRCLALTPMTALAAAWLCSTLASCRTAGLKRVFMSLDQQGNRKRTTFFADTASIFCVGELVSGRADVTVESKIKATTLYDPDSDSMVPAHGLAWLGEAAPGKTDGAFVSFELAKVSEGGGSPSQRSLYPVGTFTCELAIDGEREDSVDFDIAFPPCPVLPPAQGQLCRGWVRAGSRCQGAGALSCTCDGASGAWQCE